MRRSIAATAALLLVACGGQKDGEEQKAGEQAATAESGGGGGTVTMEPGLWETTVEVVSMDIPNMPQGVSMPKQAAVTTRNCLTPEQARAPSGDFLTGSGANSGCTTENMSMSNGRIRGTVQCNQQGGTMRATMDGRFTPTSMDMTQNVQTSGQGMNMNMESRITGRRIGDCPAG